ncbi:unnamed protein product [Cochlearia groenlandica]
MSQHLLLKLFKGYLVGNGVVDSMYDGNALVPFAYGMGLISDQLFEVCLCVRKRMFGRAWPVRAPVLPGVVPSWTQLLNDINVPCINDSVARSWLNDPTIRKAIHAKEKSEIGSWILCFGKLTFDHDAGTAITICVPYTGTQAWTHSLGYKVIDEWRAWMSNNQVAGVQDIQFLSTNRGRIWTSIADFSKEA